MKRVSRYPAEASQRLPLDLVDCLLGVHRSVDEIDRLNSAGEPYDSFLTFDVDRWPKERIDALWKAHGRQLRADARRRGLEVPLAAGKQQ